jgi:hypothetical protein
MRGRGALGSGLAAVLLAIPSFAACGGETPAPPTRERLVTMLVSADDLAGGWAVDLGTKNGHVPDIEGWGPQPFVCDTAGDAPTTPAVVTWEATRALELGGRSAKVPAGRVPWTYELRVQEFLLARSARAARKTYDAFASSMRTCATRMPGPQYAGRTSAVDLPPVGDARTGIETTFLEKGSRHPFMGDSRTVFVLDGKVLMAITLNEMDYSWSQPGQPEPQIDDVEFAEIVETMVHKLH